ncbi:MAG TPA: succinylglutamate desuccinylase/aspartoacylase family protein [Candidatus Baltobacteraceae bacterium]
MKPLNGTYQDFGRRWKALRSDRMTVREVACVGAPRTLLCVEWGDARLSSIALSAGVHGDEPAGPWALLDLVEDGALDERFAYRIWPCTNPSGFEAGTRESAEGVDVNRTFGRGGQSPEARAVVTANRDRKFVLSLDLHEDCDASGFYCYEYGGGKIGLQTVAALSAAGYPLELLHRLTPDPTAEAATLGGLSYSLAIARHAARHALTFETPSRAAWESRIGMHRTAVLAAISVVSGFRLEGA